MRKLGKLDNNPPKKEAPDEPDPSTLGFGDAKFWEDRYAKAGEATFDWLESYDTVKDYLGMFMPSPDIKIMIPGCGNAEFSEDLYDAGYEYQWNNDISESVIEQMAERNKDSRPNMKWLVMDITDMSEFESNYFDLIIDKGTMDALLCGNDAYLKVAKMLKESQRILKPGGHFFFISYGTPEAREYHFETPFLSFENGQTEIC